MRIIVPDPSGSFLVGFAKNKLKACVNLRRGLREPVVERVYKVNDFTVTAHAEEGNDFIRIDGGTFEGFLCHPRSGDISETRFDIYSKIPSYEGHSIVSGNGYNPKGELLPNGPYAYPLIDDDHGTRGVQLKSGEWKERKSPPENYGNIDWKGPKGEVLTWKGPPSRYFPLNQYLEIPGLTQLDYYIESLDGDYSQFTPFSKNIYRSGRIYAVAPDVWYPQSDAEVDHGGQVLGAALNSGKLVIIVKAIFTVHPSTPRSGNYYQAYVRDGKEWVLLGEQYLSFKPRVPFFFNQSGTEAQTVDGGSVWKVVVGIESLSAAFTNSSSAIEIQETSTSSTVTTDEAGEVRATIPELYTYPAQGGTVEHPAWFFAFVDDTEEYADYIAPLKGKKGEEVNANHEVTVRKSGEQILAVDYKGDIPVYAKASMSGTENTKFHRKFCAALNYGGKWGDVKFILATDPAVHTLGEISISEPVSVGSQATITNGCKGAWSISKGSIDPDTGEILSLSCIPGSSAYATITYTSSLGTKSKVVRFAGGVWVSLGYVEYSFESLCGNCGTSGYKTEVNGGTAYVYTIAWAMRHSIGSKTYLPLPCAWCEYDDYWGNFNSYPSTCDSSVYSPCATQNAVNYGTYSCTCNYGYNNCQTTKCGVFYSLAPCGSCYAVIMQKRTLDWRCP